MSFNAQLYRAYIAIDNQKQKHKSMRERENKRAQ